MHIERAKNYLYSLNNEIAGAKYSLDYCHEAYERLRQELQKLYEEKNKLEDLLEKIMVILRSNNTYKIKQIESGNKKSKHEYNIVH